jgi:uncharacterized protein (UPF0332 family)
MQPDAFLDLAETNLQGEDSEAFRRTAASRAYYAAFHHAAALLTVRGVSHVARPTHEAIARHIEALPLVDAGQQAQWLRDLRSERHQPTTRSARRTVGNER